MKYTQLSLGNEQKSYGTYQNPPPLEGAGGRTVTSYILNKSKSKKLSAERIAFTSGPFSLTSLKKALSQ